MQDNTEGEKNRNISSKSIGQWLFRVIKGAVIGAGAILPGISGGVLCVVFGIYQPMMALLAHPIRTFRKNALFLLPVLFGWGVGFFLVAIVLNFLFSNPEFSIPATWLFVGLIAGMVPQLFREAGKQGRTGKSWSALFISTALILAMLALFQYWPANQNGSLINIEANPFFWYFVCGILWGVSLVAPGLSSSSILIFLGLYQTMTGGIANFSFEVIIPMIIGILLTVLLSARAINYMFDKHYSSSYHIVLGFVIASTIAVLFPYIDKRRPNGELIGMDYSYVLNNLIPCALCFIVGFCVAYYMDRMRGKLIPRGAK